MVIAVEAPGRLGHWVTCWGPAICDAHSGGRWVPLGSSRLGRRFVSHAWSISPVPRIAGPVVMG
jgi:hypothetical protein